MIDIGPGSLVECVDNSRIAAPDAPLMRGRIYRVRSLAFDARAVHRGRGQGVELEGLPDRILWRGYWIGRFRPVRDGEIEIFRQLVANPHEKVSA